MRKAIAITVLGLMLAGLPAHSQVGTPEGATLVAAPPSCCPQTITYTATVQGTWVFQGDWRLVIKRGFQTMTFDSSQFIGGFRYGVGGPLLLGAILPGDRVTVTLRSVGTVASFGSLTGCNNQVECT